MLLVRNPRFREWSPAAQPAGYPDRIHLRLKLSPAAQVAAIRSGRADLTADTYDFSEAFWRRLAVASASRMRTSPANAIAYVYLNTRKRPFDDLAGAAGGQPRRRPVRLRRLDHRRILLPAPAAEHHRLPPALPVGDRPDLARARRLVARSGTRGTRVRLWTPREAPMATQRPRGGQSAGSARLPSVRPRLPQRRRVLRDGQCRRAPAGRRLALGRPTIPAPSTFVGLLRCGAVANFARFCDRGIDARARRAGALQATDPQAADDEWAGIDRRLTEAAPHVPLTALNAVNFTSERLRNYQYHVQWGPLISQLWVK